VIGITGWNGFVGLTALTTVELAHTFDELILDDGDHGRDPESGDLQWRVDRVAQSHHGDVEGVGLLLAFVHRTLRFSVLKHIHSMPRKWCSVRWPELTGIRSSARKTSLDLRGAGGAMLRGCHLIREEVRAHAAGFGQCCFGDHARHGRHIPQVEQPI
jgi:hypothetical protein